MKQTLLSFAAASIVALAQPAAAQSVDIPFEKFELDNGLTVVVHEDRKAPLVAVSVWYGVGSRDEPEGKSGFAHLFEHLMFNGTENYDDEWFKPLQEVGATDLNGTTSFDRTNYFQTVPTPALERILWMESDRMGNLLGVVTQDKLDEQRGVVQNEKRQGENQPYGRAFTNIIQNLFPSDHPYSHLPIGSMEDLDAASLDDVKAWFEEYYGAANAVLVLAGDIDAEEAKPLVEKYFGWVDAGPPLTKWDGWVPVRDADTREVMFDRVPQTRIYKLWLTPGSTTKAATDLGIAASVLGDGKNSRLYKELVYDKQTASDISVFNLGLEMASIFGVIATVKPDADVAAVEADMDETIAQFLAKGPTRKEVELVATKTSAGLIRGLEKVGGFSGKAVTLAEGELYADDPGFYKQRLQWLEEAGPRNVSQTAREWLTKGSHTLTIKPFPDYKTIPDATDRTALPAVDTSPELVFPDIQTATLSNGLEVVFAKRDAVPVVEMSIQFDAGYAADQGGKLGVASFAGAMLDEGAGKRDALELAGDLERLGANLSVSSNVDVTTVRLSALTANLEESIDIMADVVCDPAFDEEEIERLRSRWIAQIKQEKAQPIAIALRTMPPLLYGEDHAYGVPLTGSGTEESISSLTRSDLVSFHQSWMRPDNATVYVVGDTGLNEIVDVLEDKFGGWRAPSGAKPEKNVAAVPLPTAPKVVIVDRPGSPQSFILAGHLAPGAGAENNIAIEAMNDVLGGSFNARINTNLREDKGWSYGARSILFGAAGQRPWLVYAPVQTDKTAASLSEIVKEVEGYLGDNPATADELRLVTLDAIRSLPGSFETAGNVLGSLTTSGRYGRPLDYPATLKAQYDRLTPQSVTATAKAVIEPSANTR
ncbi:MAG: pitrilysin family protein, partial [Pseudomonadota bacterium]